MDSITATNFVETFIKKLIIHNEFITFGYTLSVEERKEFVRSLK